MKNGNRAYHVDSRRKAWRLIDDLFFGDYVYNGHQSHQNGYPVYDGTLGGYISDIGVALDILTRDGDSVNVKVNNTNIFITALDKTGEVVVTVKDAQNTKYTKNIKVTVQENLVTVRDTAVINASASDKWVYLRIFISQLSYLVFV